MKTKLSDRAKILLAVIRENCGPEGSYFVPRAYPVPCEMFPAERVSISGSGDARIIKSLIARGYAEERHVADYACIITEEGLLAYEALRNDPLAVKHRELVEAEQARLRAEDGDEP